MTDSNRAFPADAGRACAPSGLSRDASQAEPLVPNADELPHVVSEGTVRLGEMELKVLHLSNGERVIEADSLNALLHGIFGDE